MVMPCRTEMYLIFIATFLSSISLIFVQGSLRTDSNIANVEQDQKGIDLIAIVQQQKQMLLELAKELGSTKNAVADLSDQVKELSGRLDKQNLLIFDLKEKNSKLRKEVQNTVKAQYMDQISRTNNFSDKENLVPKEETNDDTGLYLGKEKENIDEAVVKLAYDRNLIDSDSNDKRGKRFVLNAGESVAFHVVSDRQSIPLATNQTVPFDTVLLNEGRAFHSSGSIFVANQNGIYFFSASILSYVDSNSEFMSAIVKNDEPLARIYGHGDNHRHDQGSATVVVQLAVGDEVFVRAEDGDRTLWGNRYTTFSGALLWTV